MQSNIKIKQIKNAGKIYGILKTILRDDNQVGGKLNMVKIIVFAKYFVRR